MMTDPKTTNCPTCGKSISVGATFCIYCFAGNETSQDPNSSRLARGHAPAESGRSVAPTVSETSQSSIDNVRRKKAHASSVGRRYRDAYAVAGAVIEHGRILKTLGVVVAVVVVLSFLVGAGNFRGFVALGLALGGAVLGVGAGGLIYAQGVRVCAEGQHLLASLDIAVNTSPFLDEEGKAQAMSL